MSVTADEIDLEIRVPVRRSRVRSGAVWAPVLVDGVRGATDDLVELVAKRLRACGLVPDLRWRGSYRHDGTGVVPWAIDVPNAVHIEGDKVIAVGNMVTTSHHPRAAAARIRPRERWSTAVVSDALAPTRSVDRSDPTDRMLERYVIASEAASEGPIEIANGEPIEILTVGRWHAIAWRVTGWAVPFLIWSDACGYGSTENVLRTVALTLGDRWSFIGPAAPIFAYAEHLAPGETFTAYRLNRMTHARR